MNNSYGWDFALFSANLNYFMPELGWQAHPAIYEQWLDYHRPKPIQAPLDWELSCLEGLKTGPASILCLYHLGYHAQIPRILADHAVPYDIILDRKVFEAQREGLLEMQAVTERRGMAYRFLFSEDPKVLLQARSALRQGRHLLVFADGNSGAVDKQNKVCIDFMAARIAVRRGIALLSYLLQVAIIPISHMQTDAGISLYTGGSICPEPATDREEYIHSAMHRLYGFLAQELYAAPYRWEAWNYLQEQDCLDIVPQHDADGLVQEGNPEVSIRLALQGRQGYFNRINYSFTGN